MRTLFAVFGVCAAIGLAAPAYADPGDVSGDVSGDDQAFVAVLAHVGIKYPSPAAAIATGKSVCGCLNGGVGGLELVHEVKTRNPGFTMEDASDFAMIAAKYYCPQQLSKS